MSSLPWTDKYKPKMLDDIMGHENIIIMFKKFLMSKVMTHLLLYGSAGTGKTSSILTYAKELYGDDYKMMVLELNASDDRGIDVVRQKIKQFISSGCINNHKFKLVILDEADAMTNDAQSNLRRMMEKYTYNARFCLICNYITKIIPALQSRCVKLRFSMLSHEDMKKKLMHIIISERVVANSGAINAIIEKSNGDMRKLINIVQAVATTYNEISEKNLYNYLGCPTKKMMEKIYATLKEKKFNNCFEIINSLRKIYDLSLCNIISELTKLILNDSSLNEKKMADIFDAMANLEHNLLNNTNEQIQLGCLVSIFKLHL
jgi:replication factor C subunit 3/5